MGTTVRSTCNICGCAFDDDRMRLIPVHCNVRKFAHEVFHMWRCPDCRTIHCWEHVDLDRYYEGYAAHETPLSVPLRLAYREQLRRFRRAGMTPEHRLLDYGCGGGQFVKYLRTKGYARVVGYDPYGDPDGFGNAVLEKKSFDYILLSEVIEHVEEPRPLLAKLSGMLKKGGFLLVGTPNSDYIDLEQVDVCKHHLHVPYHLHIYARTMLDRLADDAGLCPITSYRRFFAESPVFGMNEAFFRSYAKHLDDTVDVMKEPIRIGRILTSPTLLFHGSFGYLYSTGKSIAVLYRKQSSR